MKIGFLNSLKINEVGLRWVLSLFAISCAFLGVENACNGQIDLPPESIATEIPSGYILAKSDKLKRLGISLFFKHRGNGIRRTEYAIYADRKDGSKTLVIYRNAFSWIKKFRVSNDLNTIDFISSDGRIVDSILIESLILNSWDGGGVIKK